jgi:hypothetical protein
MLGVDGVGVVPRRPWLEILCGKLRKSGRRKEERSKRPSLTAEIR